MTFHDWYWAAGGWWCASACLVGAMLGGVLGYVLGSSRARKPAA